MIDLTFLSTNSKKLANFRHLARGRGVRILSFHERTFHASYDEPRLDDRPSLLKVSYERALKQWTERAGLSDEEFFFFEDTSVSILALSEKAEYPGVNVKYWMQSTTFSSIDTQLRELGNNRSVAVRSDIVLHIPPSVRLALHLSTPFLQFTGVAEGVISEIEFEVRPSLVRPWQDSSSFNKWFIPAGEMLPFSALSAERAAQHDFRGHAFSKLVDFIELLGISTTKDDSPARQLEFSNFPKPPLLVICGPTCSGKTTAADYLVRHHGYMHFEASDFMRAAFYEMHGRKAGQEISEFARQVLQDEPWTVPSKILAYMSKFDGIPIVVTGFRSQLEVDYFYSECSSSNRIVMVYIDAEGDVRYDRACSRGRHDTPPTFKSFLARSDEQMRMGLADISQRAGNLNFSNSGEILSLYKFCDVLVDPLVKEGVAPVVDMGRFGSLELAVIEVLGRDDTRRPATTTEIANLINMEVNGRAGTAKDNVSRYFNQRVSPFYVITVRDESLSGEVASYAITQTGRAMWQRIKGAQRRPLIRQQARDIPGSEQFDLF